ncbi:transposase family protein [Archangium violaceum]|uniref:transposase family protein n=1 Tax=Archangium violaceum TaxID=83451 RepID=UPI00193AF786
MLTRLGLTFKGVEDPRANRGKRHPLAAVLTLLVQALAVGRRVLRRAEALGEDMLREGTAPEGLKRPVSDTTLDRLLGKLEPEGLEQEVHQMVHRGLELGLIRHELFARGVVSIDGKAGESTPGQPPCEPSHTTKDEQGREYWYPYALRASLTSSAAQPVLDFCSQRSLAKSRITSLKHPNTPSTFNSLWSEGRIVGEDLRGSFGPIAELVQNTECLEFRPTQGVNTRTLETSPPPRPRQRPHRRPAGPRRRPEGNRRRPAGGDLHRTPANHHSRAAPPSWGPEAPPRPREAPAHDHGPPEFRHPLLRDWVRAGLARVRARPVCARRHAYITDSRWSEATAPNP